MVMGSVCSGRSDSCCDASIRSCVQLSMRKFLAISAVLLGGALVVLSLPIWKPEIPYRALERLLEVNLKTMRDVIQQYHGDKGTYPESLEAMIDAGYLRKVPIDPFTKSRETWRLKYERRTIPAGIRGIVDVHSGAHGTTRDGRPLSSL